MKNKNKKRILVLNFELFPVGGGAGVVTLELARELSKEYKVDIVTSKFKDLPKQEKVTESLEIFRVTSFRKKIYQSTILENIVYLFSAFIKIHKLIKTRKYAICHCHFVLPTGILAFILNKIYKIPYVVTIHGTDVPRYDWFKYETLHKITPFISRIILNNALSVVTASDFMAHLITKFIKSKRDVVVINQGFNANNILPKEKKKIVVLSGRFIWRKRIDRILREMKDIDSDYIIHCIGDGPYKNEVEKAAKKMKMDVVFYGWLDSNSDEYKKILTQSDIFISPSTRENWSVCIQEAMSAGCLVIATDTGGNAELLGDSGILINREIESKELKNIFNITLKDIDRVRDLQDKARKRIEKMTWNICADKYKSIFNLEKKERVKIIYILGNAHSGSTLLDLSMSTAPEVFSVGELSFYEIYRDKTKFLFKEDPFFWCTCGKDLNTCEFWSQIDKDKNLHIHNMLSEWNKKEIKDDNKDESKNTDINVENSYKKENAIPLRFNWLDFIKKNKKKILSITTLAIGRPRKPVHESLSYDNHFITLKNRYLPIESDINMRDDTVEIFNEIYRKSKKNNPNLEYILDSSKSLCRLMYYLQRSDELDIYPVFIMRDIPALAYSWSKKGREEKGLVERNYLESVFATLQIHIGSLALRDLLNNENWSTIDYKKFIKNPKKIINKLNKKLNISIPENKTDLLYAINNSVHHNINGNELRLSEIKDFICDDDWKKKLNTQEIIIGKILDFLVYIRRMIRL